MNRAIAILVLCLALASCSTPPIGIVKVPVPVECREPIPDRPAMPTDAVVSARPLDSFVAALLAEISIREGYEVRLLVALQGCTKPIATSISTSPAPAPVRPP